jgi:hypothetical protein
MTSILTIDQILNQIESHGVEQLSVSVPNRDRRILKNLAKMIKMPEFITESQGRLLIKILQENLESFNFIGASLIPSLKSPAWSKNFKVVDVVKQINIIKGENNSSLIDIECTFNKEIRKALAEITKSIEGNVNYTNGKNTQFLLTEKNLYNVLTALKKFNFDKSPQVQAFYDEIIKFNKNDHNKKFIVDQVTNAKFIRLLTKEIDNFNPQNALLLEDRKIKFQYTLPENTKLNLDDSLLTKIASRKHNKVFVNSQQYTLLDLARVVQTLRRLPVLFIFDEYNTKSCLDNLNLVKSVLDEMQMPLNVGVYFRFNNEGQGEEFNKLVSDYGYNKQLDSDNKISIISNNKLPKFFLKNDWYPRVVISFSNQLRNNKTAVYCNECDLIVYYNTTPPVIGTVDAIV